MDISRNTQLVNIEGELKKKHIQILINEKKSSIAALTQRLKDLIDIEQKKLEFQIEIHTREITALQGKIIDVEPIKEKD